MGKKLIAFVFIIEGSKSIIKESIINKRFVYSFEKQNCIIPGKMFARAKRGTHSYTIYLPVHNIIETEFNGASSRLHQLKKSRTRKRRQSKLAIIQRIGADINGFCKRNVSKKAADIIQLEQRKTGEGKLKTLTLSAKVKERETQWIEHCEKTGSKTGVSHWANWCCAEPAIDKIRRKSTSFLQIFPNHTFKVIKHQLFEYYCKFLMKESHFSSLKVTVFKYDL